MIPELNGSTVRMRDRMHVENIIKELIGGGKERLQVISDFDMTLSRYVDDNGKPCDSCYHALDISRLLPIKYNEEATQLKNKYYPIEVDPKLTMEEKIPHMVEWWTKAHDLLLNCKIQQNWIRQIVSDSKIYFRDECEWLFRHLNIHEIPLLVFSAGIGDIIEETFKSRATLYDNIKVVSNFMDFNEQGELVGFKGELMHVFNKNENVVHQSDYFENLSHRDNIVLMGDSLGDLRMADGANCNNVLRIGFLNDQVEANLPAYLDAFDIVLTKDQTMTVPNAIIKAICPSATNTSA